jgi:deoxyribose-phosphate aldolase
VIPHEPQRVAALIDHTLLKPDATQSDIETLCREAVEYGFASVCVNPVWVALCARVVQGSPVRVCSVVGFPLGATVTDAKRYEAERAIADGATEVDMVIHLGALKSGHRELVRSDIGAVVDACLTDGGLCKVIIEAALLSDEQKVTACTLATEAGAHFVKTSTGFARGGATLADVRLMRRIVGPAIGVKASGGIRDLEALRAMVAAGATRIGTSAGVSIVREFGGERSASGTVPPPARPGY